MSLRHSYRFIAPVYDLIVDRPTAAARARSLQRLNDLAPAEILIAGIGTGLDIPHLPAQHRYTGTDITPAMLERANARASGTKYEVELLLADSMRLPFDDDRFDHVIMHLILAVVPDPGLALQEASRVLRPGGSIFVLDKFLRPGQRAPLRRALNTITRHIATRTDVVLETLLEDTPELVKTHDVSALAGGWFRLIELTKTR